MKHEHSELIKRWAGDASLSLLVVDCNDMWVKSNYQDSPKSIKTEECFLVCGKHEDAALHWLNGGEIECNSTGNWEIATWGEPNFSPHTGYRIKPKLEKVEVYKGAL